ncbi:uncharacterized protein ACA1_371230 [Acanthamoeba castellanii str. Neff]|uniref:Uncharacterized protein n=1 Tax=Acanthamoeba castellanii (strain ATCC 30010 / Neff) TaxID=1257118 RepID=L8H0K1_ACACF|nr:uncharacterized protein ACA1_371230 [Acanthamoeba castellanii str. Neff]ELR18298.1 hypothetical protein ACA1_371230 [Acanthamoeba castellanii str. Neff]
MDLKWTIAKRHMPKALNHLAEFCKSKEAIEFILWTSMLFHLIHKALEASVNASFVGKTVRGSDGQDWTAKKVRKPWGGYMHWWVCIQHCMWAAYTIYCNFLTPEIAPPFNVCVLFDAL